LRAGWRSGLLRAQPFCSPLVYLFAQEAVFVSFFLGNGGAGCKSLVDFKVEFAPAPLEATFC
jgi:hypothetical protein